MASTSAEVRHEGQMLLFSSAMLATLVWSGLAAVSARRRRVVLAIGALAVVPSWFYAFDGLSAGAWDDALFCF